MSERLDSLLEPYVRARGEAESERLLSLLVTEEAAPVVEKIVGYKMHVSGRGARAGGRQDEAEDIRSEVMLQLVQRLQNFRNDYAEHPIGDFRAYVATVTYNAFDRHVSRKYPQRRRLKNGLRYLLTHRPGFALWRTEAETWVGGLSEWHAGVLAGRAIVGDESAAAVRLQQLRDDPRAFASETGARGLPTPSTRALSDPKRAPDLLQALFAWTGAPVDIDLLTTVFAAWWGVTDETVDIEGTGEGDGHESGAGARLADIQPDVSVRNEQRVYLKRLWEEITALPPRQRAALLLNLRDEQGRGVADLWALTGIASHRVIAEACGMTPEEFARIWNELPLDDKRIAAHLGLARQQVINLRKSARERLARRMKGF